MAVAVRCPETPPPIVITRLQPTVGFEPNQPSPSHHSRVVSTRTTTTSQHNRRREGNNKDALTILQPTLGFEPKSFASLKSLLDSYDHDESVNTASRRRGNNKQKDDDDFSQSVVVVTVLQPTLGFEPKSFASLESLLDSYDHDESVSQHGKQTDDEATTNKKTVPTSPDQSVVVVTKLQPTLGFEPKSFASLESQASALLVRSRRCRHHSYKCDAITTMLSRRVRFIP
jgi:hypothetical protein